MKRAFALQLAVLLSLVAPARAESALEIAAATAPAEVCGASQRRILQPELDAGCRALSSALALVGDDPSRAARLLQEAAGQRALRPFALRLLGRAQLALGQLAKAVATFGSIGTAPASWDAPSALAYARAQAQLGQPLQAGRLYDAVLLLPQGVLGPELRAVVLLESAVVALRRGEAGLVAARGRLMATGSLPTPELRFLRLGLMRWMHLLQGNSHPEGVRGFYADASELGEGLSREVQLEPFERWALVYALSFGERPEVAHEAFSHMLRLLPRDDPWRGRIRQMQAGAQ